EVLPSMAIMSGPVMRSRSTQLLKHVLNRSGSMAAITSHSVSWLGIPRANGKKRRRKARCSSPHSVSSTKSSAPATVPHSSKSSSSGKGYSTFAACLGSRSAANCVRNGTVAGRAIEHLQHEASYESYFTARRNPPPVCSLDCRGGELGHDARHLGRDFPREEADPAVTLHEAGAGLAVQEHAPDRGP